MKKYYRVMLGRKSKYAEECLNGGFIGADFGFGIDFTGQIPDNWRDFNKQYIPVYISNNPDKTKIAAGLACGMLWTIIKGLSLKDIVLCPDGNGVYKVGEIIGEYSYHPGQNLQHQRAVKWLDVEIDRAIMSESLRHSAGSIGTVSEVTKYAEEIESFIIGKPGPTIIGADDDSVEDPVVFALEMHLEDFLVKNWQLTALGSQYDIVEVEGELVGQQYPSDTGPIDILAVSKDKSHYLVIELKKGRASDRVVGQIQRYMGFVLEEVAEEGQSVKGAIIALEDDLRIRRALSVASNIDFYRYEVNFSLKKG